MAEKGISISLRSVAAPMPTEVAQLQTLLGEPLSAEAAQALFEGLEPLDESVTTFHLRPETLPPALQADVKNLAFFPQEIDDEALENGPLKVMYGAPTTKGEPIHQVLISFTRSVVALGDDLGHHGIDLKPEVPGAWRWLDTQTICFEPEGGLLPGSTSFCVEVSSDLRSHDGTPLDGPFQMVFETHRLALLESWPNRDLTPGTQPQLVARFNQQVDASRVVKALQETLAVQTVPTNEYSPEILEKIANFRPETFVVFRPAAPLPPERSFAFCLPKGFAGGEGPLPTTDDLRFSFKTAGEFRVHRTRGSKDSPESSWRFEFTNDVDPESFKYADFRITPDAALHGWSWGGSISLSGPREANTSYSVVLPEGLRDVHGQVLQGRRKFVFQTSNASPRLQGPSTRIVTLPPHRKPVLPVHALEMKRLDVQVFAVNPKDFEAINTQMSDILWNDGKPKARELARWTVEVARPEKWAAVEISLEQCFESSSHLLVIVEPKRGPMDAVMAVFNRGRRPRVVHWVQRTNLSASVLSDAVEGHVLVTRLDDSTPLQGVDVWAGERGPFTTDARGRCALEYGTRNDRIHLQYGDDECLVEDVLGWTHAVMPPPCFHAFSDRKLYKPGERVQVAGWVRTTTGTSLQLPARATLGISGRDAHYQPVLQASTEVGADGEFAFEFLLPSDVTPGTFNVRLTHPVGQATLDLDVQEFRRPEFEVTTQVGDRAWRMGDEVPVSASARYFTGEALSAAQLQWEIDVFDTDFSPPGWPGYTFGKERWRPWFFWKNDAPQTLATASLVSTADEEGSETLGVKVDGLRPDQTVRVTATVSATDVQRQTFAGTSTFLVHPSDLFAGLKPTSGFVRRGEPVQAMVVLVDSLGKSVSGRRVDVALEFLNADGVVEVASTTQVVSTDDPVTVEIAAPRGGAFTLTATSADAEDRAVRTSVSVWVAGSILPDTNVTAQNAALIPASQSWQVGQTATVLLVPPFERGEGSVGIEYGGRVREHRTFSFDGTHTLEVPVTADMVPGLSIHAQLVATEAGVPQFATGSLELDVSREHFSVSTVFELDDAEHEPGDECVIRLHAKYADGATITGGMATVWVVDEAVLALAGYDTPDPLTLYRRVSQYLRKIDVRRTVPGGEEPEMEAGEEQVYYRYSANSMDDTDGGGFGGAMFAQSFAEAPPEALAPGAPMAARSAGAPSLPPTGKPVYVRQDFSALALWAPNQAMDAQGRVELRFKLPDNLTRYRVMANVAVGPAHFGSGDAGLVVRQPFMVRPTKPRFLNVSDRAEFPVVLHNTRPQPERVWVALRATHVDVDPPGFFVELPGKSRREVRVPVTARRAGTATFQVVARTDTHSDAAQDTFDVLTPATREAVGTSGVLETGVVVQSIDLPKHAWDAYGGLDVSLSSTILASLTDLLVDVVEYRYACAEQRASRVMAVALLGDFLTAFAGPDTPSPEAMEAAVAADLKELQKLQHSNGGWGFWYAGRVYPVVTIHVMHALIVAHNAGFAVDERMLENGLGYLADIERHVLFQGYSAETRRFLTLQTAWVLTQAGIDQHDRALKIYKKASKHGTDELAWYLSIFANSKSKEATHVYEKLLSRMMFEGGKLQFADEVQEIETHAVLASSTRTNALVLHALLDLHRSAVPHQPVRFDAIVGAVLAGRGRAQRTTQESAMTLLGVMAYFRAFEAEAPNSQVSVYANAFALMAQSFVGRSTDVVHQHVPMAWLSSQDPVRLGLLHQGSGRVYWRANLRWAPRAGVVDAKERGFSVERTFEAVDDPHDVVLGDDGVWRVRAGARVRIRTRLLTRKPRHHVALNSPIPAGFELTNPELKGQGRVPDESSTPGHRQLWAVDGHDGPWFLWDVWWRRWFDHQVLRDDRAEAFAAQLRAGVHEHVVFARATMPGEYVVPPARAEEMYAPEVWGRGASQRVHVLG